MAKISLTEDELRSVVRKIIKEGYHKSIEAESDLETDEGIEFSVGGDVDYTSLDDPFTLHEYWLIDGTYDPQFKTDIENYIANNYRTISDKLEQSAQNILQNSYDEAHDYNPNESIEECSDDNNLVESKKPVRIKLSELRAVIRTIVKESMDK